jgi:hypothetical protein
MIVFAVSAYGLDKDILASTAFKNIPVYVTAKIVISIADKMLAAYVAVAQTPTLETLGFPHFTRD